MRLIKTRYLPRLIAVFGVIVGLLLTFFTNLDLIRYPAGAGLIGSLLFIKHEYSDDNGLIERNGSKLPPKIIDILAFVLLIVLALITVQKGYGVPDSFYPLTFVLVLLLGYRILYFNFNTYLILCQVFLLTLIIRAVYWYSYPVYGQDSRLHMGLTGFILTTGNLPKKSITYYQYYPLAHIYASIGTLISSVDLKVGMFLFLSSIQVITVLIIYLLSIYLFKKVRIGLLAGLIYSIAGPSIHFGSDIYAQTYGDVLFSLAIFSFILICSNRFKWQGDLLFVIFGLLTVFAHNLAPTALVGVLFVISLVKYLMSKLANPLTIIDYPKHTAKMLLGIMTIATIYYWIITKYFLFQFHRVLSLILYLMIGPSTDLQNKSHQVPIIEIQGIKFPPIFMFALPILVVVIGITFLGLWTFQKRVNHVEVDGLDWILVSIFSFGAFAVLYVVGGRGFVIRGLPIVVILISPVLALFIAQFSTRNNIDTIIVLFLLFSFVFAGVLNTTVAIPERTSGSFKPVGTSEDVQSLQFVQHHGIDQFRTDSYMAGTYNWTIIAQGQYPRTKAIPLLKISKSSNSRNYHSFVDSENGTFVYSSSFKDTYNVKPPSSFSKIYSSSRAQIFTSRRNGSNS